MMRERGLTSPSAPRRRRSGRQIGPGGEIVGADAFVGAEQFFQLRPSHRWSRRPRRSRCGRGTARPPRRRLRRPRLFHERVLDACAERVAVERPARHADDAGRIGELAARLPVEERGIELAVGEVAGTAEDEEVERIDLDDSGPCVRPDRRSRQRSRAAVPRRTRRRRGAEAGRHVSLLARVLEENLAVAGKRLISGSAAPPIARASAPIVPGTMLTSLKPAPVEIRRRSRPCARSGARAPTPASRRR